ncbi:hypothetical protein CSUI_008451 [Cystoisospora suis]|uniref:Uncharacterized protein n=1 Tax=Cystoisospora suis TaxID=483139 RepID=A0A2C6KMK9_9APIC|nr:hypothetical protein CSUI_008451 [Cystoisospora suis]
MACPDENSDCHSGLSARCLIRESARCLVVLLFLLQSPSESYNSVFSAPHLSKVTRHVKAITQINSG